MKYIRSWQTRLPSVSIGFLFYTALQIIVTDTVLKKKKKKTNEREDKEDSNN